MVCELGCEVWMVVAVLTVADRHFRRLLGDLHDAYGVGAAVRDEGGAEAHESVAPQLGQHAAVPLRQLLVPARGRD